MRKLQKIIFISFFMITVSIINYKTPLLVKKLVNSIKSFSKKSSYEIIILDNFSEDDSRKILKFDDENIKIIWSDKNLGFWAWHNLVRKNAKWDYLFFLNSDTLFFENTLYLLQKSFEKLEEKQKVWFFQPRLFLDIEKSIIQDSCSKKPTLFNLILENIPFLRNFFKKSYKDFKYLKWDRNSSRNVDIICWAAMFCKTKFFDEIWGFDERFFLYFEEYDICWRALSLGYKNYYTIETSIIHFRNKSPSSSFTKKKMYLKSLIKFILKKYGN